MSGIAVIHESDRESPVDRDVLEGMLDVIQHRGPDGRGDHVEPGIGLAECHLAVIDAEDASRPASSEDGRFHVVLDGAISNYRDLHSQLESGQSSPRQGDAGVLLSAYRQWGADCVFRLRGAFAFAIWDSTERELFVARDPSGVKPLYVSFGPERTHLASEAKAVLSNSELRAGIDLIGYLGGIDFDGHLQKTPFLGIAQLAPGCTLRCAGSKRATSRYWTWNPTTDSGRLNPMNVVADFGAALHEAVGLELESDGPIALGLSGGIDSAALAASLVVHRRRDIVTYTFESEGDETRDGLASEVAARFLKLENRKLTRSLSSVSDEEIRRLAWQAEGEFTLGFLERREIAKAARADGVKVLLTGQGIDEVLTGAYRSYDVFRSTALVRHLTTEMVPSPRGWPRFKPAVLGAVGAELAGWMGRDRERWWAELAATQLRRDYVGLSHGMLRFEDRMCAAEQIEARAPYLDSAFLEFCASIPEGSRAELFSSKRILRSAAAGLLPRHVAGRPRAVSSAWQRPVSTVALANDGVLASLLDQQAVEARGLFSWPEVEAMKATGDHVSLDHVLLLHLLDDVFIRNFNS